MMQIPCPWCGPRNATEFRHHGPHAPRPDPATASAEEWRRYLYLRPNPYGPVEETWYHAAGCRRFVSVIRDTFTNATQWSEGGPR
ncbi:sarcosine oxidase subunit delta [Nesterenkonia natronophila]|uniref:Sarcosine oxidase subunit delta n=2 Tax=Nesterenkonia natronophila TaxID=2174932 RepID=A0A3A4F268_9MICC|nr:sarcosine oxidase subunit delta [Nesterenkonia natronophila]